MLRKKYDKIFNDVLKKPRFDYWLNENLDFRKYIGKNVSIDYLGDKYNGMVKDIKIIEYSKSVSFTVLELEFGGIQKILKSFILMILKYIHHKLIA
ncbi:MAG: hypothetical protein LBI78_07505 [Campylobacteraceae bacterium]|jgi:hypothetical protein|nr:hypothetical protein [Campylobacteraceae bacterium]